MAGHQMLDFIFQLAGMFCNWTGPEILKFFKPDMGKLDWTGLTSPTTGLDRTGLKTRKKQTGIENRKKCKQPDRTGPDRTFLAGRPSYL